MRKLWDRLGAWIAFRWVDRHGLIITEPRRPVPGPNLVDDPGVEIVEEWHGKAGSQ